MPVRDFRVRPLEVLVVDDDRTFGESLALFLSDDERITVTDIACDLGSALDSTRAHHFDLALIDVRLETQSGFQVVEALREQHPGLATLMMSGLDTSEIESEALACGADGVLQKTELARLGQEAVLDAYLAGSHCAGDLTI
ncbi:MAG TPA: response regulator [Gaiellaceae bacterium]|jgi:DNA-binding NarL/FixJ family response regulator|nr:response regulator [Gaiellaceae bacterium]